MLLTDSQDRYKCSLCLYTTKRKYNYDRHINLVHNMLLSSPPQNIGKTAQNIDTTAQNIDTNSQNIDITSQNIDTKKCFTCYKSFSNQYSLNRHTPKCQHITHQNQCKICRKVCSSYSALYHHRRYCKGIPQIESKDTLPSTISHSTVSIINNIQQQNVNTINNININLLTCPLSRDEKFDFNCEEITSAVMSQIINHTTNGYVRFNRFIGKVLENPKNQIIRKTNPKDTHSLVHIGNGKWELAHDKDTLPIITHHMTTAALGKCIEIERQANQIIYSLKNFQNQVKEINEMDYDDTLYKDILQRVKLALVNFTIDLQTKDILII